MTQMKKRTAKTKIVYSISIDKNKNLRARELENHIFDIRGTNVCRPNIEFEISTAMFNCRASNGQGNVMFPFPVVCFGPTYNYSKVHETMSTIMLKYLLCCPTRF